jgi:glycosyltransferase involved in cell wall biosynthesis
MENEKISVVIPCYNEGRSIYSNLTKIHAYLLSHFAQFEIIAVNDGSKDETLAELDRCTTNFPLTIINNPINTGKGDAVKKGILASSPNSTFVMFLDADLAIPIEETQKFINVIHTSDIDIAIASRFVPGLNVLEPILLHRRIMEFIFRFLRAIILHDWQVRDSQCGFKVFRRNAAIHIFTQTTVKRFAFDSEVIFLARKLNLHITELPITLCNPRESHINLFFDPINMFWALFAIRWNHIRGIYNLSKK